MNRKSCILTALLLIAFAAAAYGAKTFAMPRAFHAKTYPARDDHPQEKVTIAADPYDTEDKQQQIFSVNFREHDLLPVFLIVTNDSDQPISLADLSVEMITSRRAKLQAASMEDVLRRIQGSMKRPDSPRVSPIPLPRRAPKPTVKQAVRDEIDSAMFHARAVEAHSTMAGFFFFDVQDLPSPLAGSQLICSGVKNDAGHDLFFFEIPMEKYLTYQPGKTP